MIAVRLPHAAATSTICLMREMFDANVVVITRPGARDMIASRRSPTWRSDCVYPATSARVESESSSSTPCAAISESRAKSVCFPSTGVWSNFQSPECTIVP